MALTLKCAKHYMLCQRLSMPQQPRTTVVLTVWGFGVRPDDDADMQRLEFVVNHWTRMIFAN